MGSGDIAPEVFPSNLHVQSNVDTVRQVPISIFNPDIRARTYRVETSWENIYVDPQEVRVEAGERVTLHVWLLCPEEVGAYQGDITVRDDSSRSAQSIAVGLVCHPDPGEGSAELSVSVSGLPASIRGHVEISGPENTALFLTTTREFSDLPPGRYTLSTQPVDFEGHEMRAGDEPINFELEDGQRESIEIRYDFPRDAQRASLMLEADIPDATEPIAFELRGPPAMDGQFLLPAAFDDLRPGAYELRLQPVITGDARRGRRLWEPVEESITFFLHPGESHDINIAYRDALVVTDEEDGAEKSLRNIIEQAPAHGIITVASNLEEIILDGPIVIEYPLRIRSRASAPEITTLGYRGALMISKGADVEIRNLRFFDAAGHKESAITNRGTLTLIDVRITGSRTTHAAGAITSSGALVASGLIIEENRSTEGPGAIYVRAGKAHLTALIALSNWAGRGGALHSEGAVFAQNAYFAHNEAAEGGAIYNRGLLDLRDATFLSNQARGKDSFGGAIMSDGQAYLTNATFIDNEATFGSTLGIDGGSISLAHITLTYNPRVRLSDIYVGPTATITSRNSVFSGQGRHQRSLDVIAGATLESLGGNIIPSPPQSWPKNKDDELKAGNEPRRLSFEEPIEVEGWIRALPLVDKHPGRLRVAGDDCVDARGMELKYDKLQNPRRISDLCDAGAYQSTSAVEWEIQEARY